MAKERVKTVKIACRVRSDDSFVDVCNCVEFNNEISGLSIAWVLGHIKELRINSSDISVFANGKTAVQPVDIQNIPLNSFIQTWRMHNPTLVLVSGVFEKMEVSISVLFEKRQLSFAYSRVFDGRISPLEKLVESHLAEQFTVLHEVGRESRGSKMTALFTSPLFDGKEAGLRMTALSATVNATAIRWYGIYSPHCRPGEMNYAEKTDSIRLAVNTFVDRFKNNEVEKSTMVLYWKGKHLSVSCHYLDQYIIQITWDKWLGRDIETFIKMFNTIIFEEFYGGNSFPEGL